MADRGRVVEVDRDFAGVDFEAFGVVGERAFVGSDFDRAAGARGFFFAGFSFAFFFAAAFVFFLFGFLFFDRPAGLLFFDFLAGLLELGRLCSCSSLAWSTAKVAAPPARTTNQRTTSGKALPGKLLDFSPMKLKITAETASAIPKT